MSSKDLARISAIAVLVGFIMPWIHDAQFSHTGLGLLLINLNDAPRPGTTFFYFVGISIIFVPVCGVFSLIASYLGPKNSRWIYWACSILAFASMLSLFYFIDFQTRAREFGWYLEYGPLVVAFSLLLVLVSGLFAQSEYVTSLQTDHGNSDKSNAM